MIYECLMLMLMLCKSSYARLTPEVLHAWFIKEVYHLEWLANPVLVWKKSGKWRMCVDYIGLNKACPKDLFPLPWIDQIVDSTSGCETLCFLNAYSGYHQITMKESDQLTTYFITHSDHSAMFRCCSVWRMLGQLTSAVCSIASETSSGEPLRPMSMTSL